MPLIEEVVGEHLKFADSKRLNRFVACGYYSGSTERYGLAGRAAEISRLSFRETRLLLSRSRNVDFMSLPQYWMVLDEFGSLNNDHIIKSLRDDENVELLDTIVYNSNRIENNGSQAINVTIQEAALALIRPGECSRHTGLPHHIHSPNKYGGDSLWRHWSPDCDENVATRGHIFVMNQTCIDMKIRPDEKTACLTFRPVYGDIPSIKYSILSDPGARWVRLSISPRLYSVFEM